jgi:hypothetical protein
MRKALPADTASRGEDGRPCGEREALVQIIHSARVDENDVWSSRS